MSFKQRMSFEQRKAAIKRMALHLNDPGFSAKLIAAYLKDTGFLRKDIVKRELEAPAFLMESICEESAVRRNYGIDPDTLRPMGTVVVFLPKNGINLIVSKAICSSYLAGNETFVKLPTRLLNSAACFKQLLEDFLPGVKVVGEGQHSANFLKDCIDSSEIDSIVIYGDDKWIWSYKNAIRRSGQKLIFEGPGNDPQIIMEDADLDLAVSDAIECGLLNGGQSCSAMERFFVHESVLDDFIERLVDKISALKVGNPEEEDSDVGPIYSENVMNRLKDQVKNAMERGAELITGGKEVFLPGTGRSAFLPTVIVNCQVDMNIVQEENFGPVFPIISFSAEPELLEKLDATTYGLNASIYGSCSEEIANYLDKSHRNVYFNSTVTSGCNRESRILDGGFKNSGLIWEWRDGKFLQTEGRRLLLKELSI